MKPYHRIQVLFFLLSTFSLVACGGGNSPNMELGGINTGDMMDGLLDRTMRTLGSVNSIQTAEAAEPQLKAINDDFDDLIYHLPKLTPEGRNEMSTKARKAFPEIQDMANRINEMGSLGKILGPEMDAMVEKVKLLL